MINLPYLKQTEVGRVVRGNRWRSNDLRMMKELWGTERLFSENLYKFFQGIRNAESVVLCTSSFEVHQIVYNTCTLMPCFLISSLVLIPPPSMLCSLKKSNKIAEINWMLI